MKKIKLLPIILILTLLVSALGLPALALEQPEINSPRAVLMDAASGRVFYEKDADSQAYPASLTKVMTVLVAVEAIERGEFSLTDSVTASERCLEGMVDDGSTAGIVPGETMPLQDLLYCALLASANEACNVIAEYVSGSVEAFVEQMNALAAELGCSGTHFANTHGLPDDDHYTTARDMAVIYREAISHELFAEISGSVGYTAAATNVSGERQLSNTNSLINQNATVYPGYYYEYAKTGKTGHTTAAGYCLASSAEKDGVSLIAVVLGGEAPQNSSGGYDYQNFIDSRTSTTGASRISAAARSSAPLSS
ncbi:MAG: D-alanyl-D-alanine carboxypeptidase family protein [Lachnospiraceae bacterium]